MAASASGSETLEHGSARIILEKARSGSESN